ncbi:MAG: lysylphosphatidylglycerol synthase domain-containing protein [Planctomycetota bacterium]
MKRPRILTLIGTLSGLGGLALLVHLFSGTGVLDQLRALPAVLLLMIPLLAGAHALKTLSWLRSFPAQPGSRKPPFAPAFTIRLVGEAVNGALLSAQVAGEFVKGLLATRYGTRPAAGLASGFLGKTTFTVGEMLFLLGSAGTALALFGGRAPLVGLLFTIVIGGLIFSGLVIFVQQRRLVGRGARILQALRLGPRKLWNRALPGADAIDASIRSYYRDQRRDFTFSVAWATAGWFFGAVELWLFLHLVIPVEHPLAVALVLEGGIAVVKGLSFFIPASIGVQEGGIAWLFEATGLPREMGLTYAVFRRFRELFWIGIGFLTLWWHLRRNGEAGKKNQEEEK